MVEQTKFELTVEHRNNRTNVKKKNETTGTRKSYEKKWQIQNLGSIHAKNFFKFKTHYVGG